MAMLLMALTASMELAATATGPDGPDDGEVTAFLTKVKDAVRADDPKGFAPLLNMPLRVNDATRVRAVG